MNLLKRIFFPLVFAVGLGFFLRPYYEDGGMIAGGEGSYFFDYFLVFENYAYSWYNAGAGIFATSLNFAYVFHLLLVQAIVGDLRTVNFVMVFLIYFLPFLSFYLLCVELKIKPWLSFLAALFYIVNPFMIIFLSQINQWNMIAAYIIPAFLFLILKLYYNNRLFFLVFGLHSLLFAFANANPPLMVIYQLALLLMVFWAVLYKEKTFKLNLAIKKYLIAFFSFFLFNFWWILNWLYIFLDARQAYSKGFAISWLKGASSTVPALWQMVNLANFLTHPRIETYDSINLHFSHPLAPFILILPILMIIYFLLRNSAKHEKHHLLLGVMIIVFAFLAKGTHGLFGEAYELMIFKTPLFSIFKSAGEKWGLLLVFFLVLYLVLALKKIENKKDKFVILAGLIIYIAFCSTPFVKSDFIPDYRFNKTIVGSRRYKDKIEYQELRASLNQEQGSYRVLSFPGSNNYQIALHLEKNRFYTGNDPILNNTNKPFIAPYKGTFLYRFPFIYEALGHPNFLELTKLFNIGGIVLNKNSYPWFGFTQEQNITEIEDLLDQRLTVEKKGQINLYDTKDYFLPRFYVSDRLKQIQLTKEEDFIVVVAPRNKEELSAFCLDQGEESEKRCLMEDKADEIILVGQAQSAVDELILRTGVLGLNPEGVLLPYARWKPGSLIYPLIKKKEIKARELAGDLYEEFDDHLFFGGKRLMEIMRWENKLSDSWFDKIIGEFEEEMSSAAQILEKIALQDIGAFPLLAKYEVTLEATSRHLRNTLSSNYEKDHSRMKKMSDILDSLDKQIFRIIEEHFGETKYFFRIRKTGDYEVIVENFPGVRRLVLEEIEKQDGEKIILSPSEGESGYLGVYFGERKFQEGNHFLSLTDDFTDNLLVGGWQRSGTVERNNLLSFDVTRASACQEITNWQAKSRYKISLQYRIERGNLKVFIKEENENLKDSSYWQEKGLGNEAIEGEPSLYKLLKPTENGEWRTFRSIATSEQRAGVAQICLLVVPDIVNPGAIEIKDFRVEPLLEPKVILRNVQNESNSDKPEILFKRINPTKYVVRFNKVTEPFLFIFNEGFHSGWKVYLQSKEQSLEDEPVVSNYFNGGIKEIESEKSLWDKNFYQTWGSEDLFEENHFMINNYANGWYLEPALLGENSQFVIEYWPQRLFYWGVLVTFFTFLAALFINLISHFKKRGRK